MTSYANCECCDEILVDWHDPYSLQCIEYLKQQVAWLSNRPPTDNEKAIYQLAHDSELAIARRYQNWVNTSLHHVIATHCTAESKDEFYAEVVKRLVSLEEVVADAIARATDTA